MAVSHILQYKPGNGVGIQQGITKWNQASGGYMTGVSRNGSNLAIMGGFDNQSSGSIRDYYLTNVNIDTLEPTWERAVGVSGEDHFPNFRPRGVAHDSSGNIIMCGSHKSASNDDYYVIKMSSSGSAVWQTSIRGNLADNGMDVALDTSGNIYVIGHSSSTGATVRDLVLIKLNSSGVVQFQKRYSGANENQAKSVHVDGSGNIYVGGSSTTTTAGTDTRGLVMKLNSSGVIQWQKMVEWSVASPVNTGAFVEDITVDGSGDVIAVGLVGLDAFVVKLDGSTGALDWERYLSITVAAGAAGAGNDDFRGVKTDSSGNVYAIGTIEPYTSGAHRTFIVKYNTSGTLQWRRALLNSGTTLNYGWDIVLSGDESEFVGVGVDATSAVVGGMMAIKFPTDGTGTGTYGTYTYEDCSSYTEEETSGGTDFAVVNGDVSAGTDPTFTEHTGVMTVSTVTIPTSTVS